MITQKELKKFVSYDPLTGIFIWKVSTNGRIKIGSVAGSLENNGYVRLSISGTRYLAHRLAMVYVNGECGKFVDHIDGNRKNNKIANLRCVTKTENCQNRKKSKVNTSGVTGVSLNKKNGRWRADIGHKGDLLHIGSFVKFNDAVVARKEAEKELGYCGGNENA